jgi:DNA-binding response OmpR family regulator
MTSVLIVEDNRDLAYGLKNTLEIEGYQVEVAVDGNSGLEKAAAHCPDLIVLDLMLPGRHGYDVLRVLRDQGFDGPVLILSARAEETDRIRGFRLGADQYLSKPFGILELLSRIEALVRRGSSRERSRHEAELRFGAVRVHMASRKVLRGGTEVMLSPKEYDLLVALLQRKGSVVSRHQLLRDVWGYPSSIWTRTVDTHIGELRRKLEENPAAPRHILTVRKVGYRLDD